MEITGFFKYNDLTIMQHVNVFENFKKLFLATKPSRILEIGTSSGGLTLMLRNLLDELKLNETIVVTYDINEPKYLLEQIKDNPNILVNVKNIFSHNYDELIYSEDIIDFIKSDGVTIVLCDGGSKKNEFRLLSQFLKKGDLIMAHDYSPNEEYFNLFIKDKIWNWLEIQDKDIEDSCIQHNLIPFMQEEFNKVVWVCKIKE